IGIAVLVTVLAAQFATAAHQTACNPPPQVLSAAGARTGQPVTAAAFCDQLQTKFANLQVQGGGVQSSAHAGAATALASFTKRYGDNVVSLSFDRTFAFIAI